MPQHPLKAWMDERVVLQEDLADQLEVDQTYISKIIRGHRKPSKKMAERISDLTRRRVTVKQLLAYALPKGADNRLRPRGKSAKKKPELTLVPGKHGTTKTG